MYQKTVGYMHKFINLFFTMWQQHLIGCLLALNGIL